MKERLLITVDEFHTRIALLEDERLVEYVQEPSHLDGLVGNLYVGQVGRIMPGMASAFIAIGLDRDGFLFEGDMGPAGFLGEGPAARAGRKSPSVKHLKEGDRVLVQVSKEPMGPKGARLTTQISLPGHYLVFMPCLNQVGVSRKIADAERRRLKGIVRAARGPHDGGFIVRTGAEGTEESELAAEMQSLAELWSFVALKAARAKPPALVHQEADAVARSLREILLRGDGIVSTDDAGTAARCRETLRSIGEDPGRVDLWEDRKVSLFDRYHVEEELERALRSRVWLPSGGCIVIQSTEALVAIDVNSGRFAGKKNLEETAFAINMEAAEEVVRQLRLRSLGGIIVIDFIDMIKAAHREALIAKLTCELERDRAKSRILAISEFGLVEMTRKRSHRNLERVMTGTCACCEGRGRIVAPWRVAQNIAQAAANLRSGKGVIRASSDVIRYIEEYRDYLGIPSSVRLEPLPSHQPLAYEVVPEVP